MKKFAYILSGLALLTGILVTVQSCMQADENGDIAMTEADKYIASPEYQAFLANERKDDYEKTQLLMQLPKDQYDKFMELNEKCMFTDDYNEKLAITKAMSEIVGYDILEYLLNKGEARYKMFEGKNFTPEEIMRAEIKFQYKYISETKTRATAKKETDKEALQKCYDACLATQKKDLDNCMSLGITTSPAYIRCSIDAGNRYNSCMRDCDEKHKK